MGNIIKTVWGAVVKVAKVVLAFFSGIAGDESLWATVKSWLGSGANRVRTSFVALVSSKAVWAAVIVIGFACYCGGFMTAVGGKRALRQDRDGLSTALEAARLGKAAASQREKIAADALAKAEAEIDRLKKEQSQAKSASVAATSRRHVAQPQAKPVAASGPSVPAWVPWN